MNADRQKLTTKSDRKLSSTGYAGVSRIKKKNMSNTIDFIKSDFSSTLFPLKMNRLLAEFHGNEISDFVYQQVLNNNLDDKCFLSQQKVYATKPKGHLRRTVKLDPVAEFFIYDLCYRNRAIFRPEVRSNRQCFGYRFINGVQIPVHDAYNQYKIHLNKCANNFAHNIQFDIASYFNSIYHHDICSWFSSKTGVSDLDRKAIGQFFREINSGRSIDFLPHGIYPCKMFGNEFLKFIDSSEMLKSSQVVRFMDDFTLFDNNPEILKQDFIYIQKLLGKYALNINPSKTYYDNKVGAVQDQLSNIKRSLFEIITGYEEVATVSGIELVKTAEIVKNQLSQAQIDSLISLLKDDSIEESDADYILSFLRFNSDSLLELMPSLFEKFPNLIKHMYSLCADISDKESLVTVILEYLNSETQFLEYQLFWLGAIVENHLLGVGNYGQVLVKIFELTAEMKIARAKVLEIPEQGYGLKEIRDDFLKTGQSDWLSWSSAIGSRSLKPDERNHVLNYFSKSSPMNFLVASGVKKL